MTPMRHIRAALSAGFLLGMAGAAQAVTLAVATATYSREGLALADPAGFEPLPAITATLGADYSPNDEVLLTVSGAALGGNTDANLLQPGNTACAGGALVLSFVGRSGSDVRLRVTQKNVLNTVGVTCIVGGVEVTTASLAVADTVRASWLATAVLTGQAFDAGAPVTPGRVIDQFGLGPVAALDGIVDVDLPSRGREFATDDGTVFPLSEDRLEVLTLDRRNEITAGPLALLTAVALSVKGDFSFVDNDGDGCTRADLGVSAGQVAAVPIGGGSGVLGITRDCQQLTWTYSPPLVAPFDGPVNHEITFGKAALGGRPITAPQSFSGEVRFEYALGLEQQSRSLGPLSLGTWQANGFRAFVPYLPYGPGISQIVYLTNASGQPGAVTVEAYDESAMSCSFVAGEVGAGRVMLLAGILREQLERCYGAAFTGRLSLEVSAAVPAGRAELVTAYNVNGDRVQVINSSNGRVVQAGRSTTGL